MEAGHGRIVKGGGASAGAGRVRVTVAVGLLRVLALGARSDGTQLRIQIEAIRIGSRKVGSLRLLLLGCGLLSGLLLLCAIQSVKARGGQAGMARE